MTGRLIAVVGPSGVGKDSVIAGLVAACPGLRPVTREITRPADAGGEVFVERSLEAFAQRRDAGAYVLHWGAHGLFYGIPAGVLDDLAAGQDLIVNLSRGVLAEAAARVDRLSILWLEARPETLAARLAARGRETAEDIAARLARSQPDPDLPVIRLSNDGALADTIAAARAALYPVKV